MVDAAMAITAQFASNRLKLNSWYVVQTKPRQEQIATEQLQNQDFEVYLPMCKVYRRSKRKSAQHVDVAAIARQKTELSPKQIQLLSQEQAITNIEPMFPRYLFLRPTRATQSIAVIRSTVGVSKLVTFGTQPALLSNPAVELIHQAEEQSIKANLDEVVPFKPGMQVQLQDPAFANITALVQSVSKDRVTILLEILGRPQSLQVDFASVSLV